MALCGRQHLFVVNFRSQLHDDIFHDRVCGIILQILSILFKLEIKALDWEKKKSFKGSAKEAFQ